MDLNLFEKARIRLFGNIKKGSIMKEGWKNPMDAYVIKCSKHGYVRNTVRGGRTIVCPECETTVIGSGC